MMSRAAFLLESLNKGLEEDTTTEDKQVIARGFFLICSTNFFSKLADLLASPKITLTWLMQALGASAFAIGLIVALVTLFSLGRCLCSLVIQGGSGEGHSKASAGADHRLVSNHRRTDKLRSCRLPAYARLCKVHFHDNDAADGRLRLLVTGKSGLWLYR